MSETRAGLDQARTILLSVHGPVGVLDLVVPSGATAHDVARAYATQARLPAIPLIQTALGELVVADRPLADVGLESGDVVIAVTGFHRGRAAQGERSPSDSDRPGPGAVAGAVAAALAAVLAGWFGGYAESEDLRYAVAAVLLVSGLLASFPGGRRARHRQVAAPAFGAGAAWALLAGEGIYQAPAVLAACALAAVALAAVSRTLGEDEDQELVVWMVAGVMVTCVCGAVPLLELDARVAWAVLVVLAMLAARAAPSFAIDVPDQALLDLDKLAVTAWSARDRGGKGRRGRMVVPDSAVKVLVGRGTRTVTAAAAAVLVVLVVAAPQLLQTAVVDVDLIGARVLLLCAGGAILFAARSYRHRTAQALLRLAGLWCLGLFAVEVLGAASPGWLVTVVVLSVLLGAIILTAAVATGRGWRSVWWARKAEVAETLCGSFGIAAVVVASGLFRFFWEMNS
ncbi:hypothetical protein [Nocardioides houyundeii]|uniref:hypothetical protein n=1 Tax=Nocardioides houyundeii TaxID=2045452 RepID=UPI000C76675F|nr:hypothetical protein [Nocardioides houyundeii]